MTTRGDVGTGLPAVTVADLDRVESQAESVFAHALRRVLTEPMDEITEFNSVVMPAPEPPPRSGSSAAGP